MGKRGKKKNKKKQAGKFANRTTLLTVGSFIFERLAGMCDDELTKDFIDERIEEKITELRLWDSGM